jgi:hypothetical protein
MRRLPIVVALLLAPAALAAQSGASRCVIPQGITQYESVKRLCATLTASRAARLNQRLGTEAEINEVEVGRAEINSVPINTGSDAYSFDTYTDGLASTCRKAIPVMRQAYDALSSRADWQRVGDAEMRALRAVAIANQNGACKAP